MTAWDMGHGIWWDMGTLDVNASAVRGDSGRRAGPVKVSRHVVWDARQFHLGCPAVQVKLVTRNRVGGRLTSPGQIPVNYDL